jgi:3-methyladenine DNA glycosylase AlkD
MTTQATADAFLAKLEALASSVERDQLRRSFNAGEDADPTADVVIGVRMGEVFALAKEFIDLPPEQIDQLLASPIHQVRAGALSIMGKQASRKRTPERRRRELYELYLRRTDRINDWDLVDVSAHQVVGGWLLDKSRDVLYQLARSPRWWERRIAMFATLASVRKATWMTPSPSPSSWSTTSTTWSARSWAGCCARRASTTEPGCCGSWTPIPPRRRGCCCATRSSTSTLSSGRTTSA